MAIVCMTEKDGGEFNWEKSTQGYLLSTFFYGYICTQIIGGLISDRFGGKISLLTGMMVMSSSSLLMPTMARVDVNLVMALRVLQGLVSGVAFPSLYNLFSVWSGLEERATLMSVVLSGISFANVINLPVSAGLCATGIDGGWPMVFYVPGAVGLIWCVAFHLTCFSSPSHHPRISDTEKNYLIASCQEKGRDRRSLTAPILSMMKSVPVHALWITHMCHAWGYYLVAVNLTLYGRDVLQLDVVTNGVLSCLPYVGMFAMTSTAKVFDHLRKKEFLQLTSLRKIFTTLGMLIPALCMTSLNFLPDKDVTGNIILLTLGMSGHHFAATGGYYLSHSDVAGPFSGTLFGITNTMAQIPGFANALIVAHLTPNVTFNLKFLKSSF